MPANLPESYPALAAAQADWQRPPSKDCLRDRHILVTGAGDGIGRAAAQTFACYGANVVLLGRTRSKLETVFDWISANTDTRSVIVPCDLLGLRDEHAQALADAVATEFGSLHGVLHNASLLGPKVPLAQYPSDDWEKVFQVNVHSAQTLNRALLPLLQHEHTSAVVFTSSSVGRTARAYWGAYAASKFAVEGMMQTLADELEQTSRVKVVSVNPGGTRTAMRAAAYPAENPADVPPPEAHMDLYLSLFCEGAGVPQGAQLDARDEQARAWISA